MLPVKNISPPNSFFSKLIELIKQPQVEVKQEIINGSRDIVNGVKDIIKDVKNIIKLATLMPRVANNFICKLSYNFLLRFI